MTKLLSSLGANQDPNLLVGFADSDDAGVYRISADQALVVTADIITPPVDDPYVFGQIAAANALSDIYAMGGKPVVCLNLACFPVDKLDQTVLGQIHEGAMSIVMEAGAVVAGGHTVQDAEPKFGLSVTGLIHPDRIWTNGGAQAGDKLILTKPLGSGVLFNANLRKALSPAALKNCVRYLVQLNKTSADVLATHPVNAVTDVSGYGLAGHAFEMAAASGVTLHFDSESIPLLDEAQAMYERGITTGVNKTNRAMLADKCDFGDLSPSFQELMLDPQTSGGLLIALPAMEADQAVQALNDNDVTAARIIGDVSEAADQYRLIFS